MCENPSFHCAVEISAHSIQFYWHFGFVIWLSSVQADCKCAVFWHICRCFVTCECILCVYLLYCALSVFVLKLLSHVLYNLSVCLLCGKKIAKKKKRKMPKRLKGVLYMLECIIRLLPCNVISPTLATYERNRPRKIAKEQSCQPIKSEPS